MNIVSPPRTAHDLSEKEMEWYFRGDDVDGAYHVQSIAGIEITGETDSEALERAYLFQQDGNADLRKRYMLIDGSPCWAVVDLPSKRIKRFDLANCIDPHLHSSRLMGWLRSSPYELFKESPHRCYLIRLASSRHIVLLSIHKLIGDEAYAAELLEQLLAMSGTDTGIRIPVIFKSGPQIRETVAVGPPGQLSAGVGENKVMPPLDEKQRLLLDICRKIYGRSEIEIDDELIDLGGDSLKLLKIVLELENHGYAVGINSFYTAGKIRAVAKEITLFEDWEEAEAAINPRALSPYQINYFRSYRGRNWNITHRMDLPGKSDGEGIRMALRRICERHESLRVRFYPHLKEFDSDRGMRVEIIPKDRFTPEIRELDFPLEPFCRDRAYECIREAESGLSHMGGNLAAFTIIRFQDRMVLYIVGSHLIFDANSMEILTRDIGSLCAQESSSPQSRSASYAITMNSLFEFASGPGILEQADFWMGIWKRSDGNRKLLPWARIGNGLSNGHSHIARRILLDGPRFGRLVGKCSGLNLSIMDFFLSIFRAVISECMKVERLGVSLILPGRNTGCLGIEISGTIGSFSSPAFLPLGYHDGSLSLFENARQIRDARMQTVSNAIWESYLAEIPYYHRDAADASLVASMHKSHPPVESNILVNYLDFSTTPTEALRKEDVLRIPFEIEENGNLLNLCLRNFGSLLALDWFFNPELMDAADASLLAESIERKFIHASRDEYP